MVVEGFKNDDLQKDCLAQRSDGLCCFIPTLLEELSWEVVNSSRSFDLFL